MQQQLQINWTMVQELRMDGELNNYSKYLVWELCVCVCVCMFSLSSRTCSISLGALCKCVHHNRCKSWVFFFFCPLHHLHVPLFTPELLVPAGVCGFVSRGTAAGDWISLTSAVMAHTLCSFDTSLAAVVICGLWQYILQLAGGVRLHNNF